MFVFGNLVFKNIVLKSMFYLLNTLSDLLNGDKRQKAVDWRATALRVVDWVDWRVGLERLRSVDWVDWRLDVRSRTSGRAERAVILCAKGLDLSCAAMEQ